MSSKMYSIFNVDNKVYQHPFFAVDLDDALVKVRFVYSDLSQLDKVFKKHPLLFELGSFDPYLGTCSYDVPFYIDDLYRLLSVMCLPEGTTFEGIYNSRKQKLLY